jgi:DNA polymerase
MFIGEGPGAKEDELGRPFVGAAGKFLDEMLGTIQLKRENVYIANVVKCRPPQNRDPLPEEAAECWPWLLSQITIIQPRLIVTLGRQSTTTARGGGLNTSLEGFFITLIF